MSHEPGFERLTLSEPGEGTNGVTIEAAATGEPDKSWTVIDQPFLSFSGLSISLPNELSQLLELLGSSCNDMDLGLRSPPPVVLRLNLQVKTGCLILPRI